jgi:nicotinate-nucleotide adenylyltransferase
LTGTGVAGARSRVFAALPPFGDGQRIGLYGGSFNPAHAGHRHVSLAALPLLGLDSVWWLVTPANPLKDKRGLAPIAERAAGAAAVAAHPRIAVSCAEQAFGTVYTADFIHILRQRAGTARFVWLMGGDNLASFHRWDRWRDIAASGPIAVFNRPGSLAAALSAPAARALAPYRVDPAAARDLADRNPPAWTYLVGPRTPASSTALRRRAGKS